MRLREREGDGELDDLAGDDRHRAPACRGTRGVASLKSGPPPATLQLAMGVAVVQTANPVATRPITPFDSAVIVPVSDRLVPAGVTTRSFDSALPLLGLLVRLSMMRHQFGNVPPVPPWHGDRSLPVLEKYSTHRPATPCLPSSETMCWAPPDERIVEFGARCQRAVGIHDFDHPAAVDGDAFPRAAGGRSRLGALCAGHRHGRPIIAATRNKRTAARRIPLAAFMDCLLTGIGCGARVLARLESPPRGFAPRTPLHAHSRGPSIPAPFAWLAHGVRSRLRSSEGLRPSDSPTRSLAGPLNRPLRSRGSLTAFARVFAPPRGFAPRTPLHAHSRGHSIPAPFAWLAHGVRSRLSLAPGASTLGLPYTLTRGAPRSPRGSRSRHRSSSCRVLHRGGQLSIRSPSWRPSELTGHRRLRYWLNSLLIFAIDGPVNFGNDATRLRRRRPRRSAWRRQISARRTDPIPERRAIVFADEHGSGFRIRRGYTRDSGKERLTGSGFGSSEVRGRR